MVKSCLVISYGPVPTPEFQTVEGGGMRAWGLAEGLLANGLDVTIGINAGFPQKLQQHDGIRLANWSLDADFVQLINSFDAVVVSYCMGDPSVFVADNINDDVQLVLDAYVPIYIEVSARDSKDIETEYGNYMADIQRFNRVLKRGDFFLYANSAQELLYSGVLSALGVINPRSYRETRLIEAPFGIHRTPATPRLNPYAELGIPKDAFVVLWFGGIYPWFRIEEYLEAIKALETDKDILFVFVGGKNPFNPNPDFFRQYDTAVKFAEDRKLINSKIYFVDWVDFDDRVNWFAHADVVVSLNQPGEENKYSWRTRVMDFVWGEVVTISNGGDPLSEELIANGAALRLADLSGKALAGEIKQLKNKPAELQAMKKQVIALKQKYFWDVVTEKLSEHITSGTHPYALEQPFRQQLGGASETIMQAATISRGKLGRIAEMPFKVVRKMRQKGVVRSAKIGVSIVKNQIKNRQPVARPSQFIFISHPINNTGAPVVLLQVIEEYVKKYGARRVRLIAPGVEKEQKDYLRKLGVSVEQAVFGVGFRFIRLQLGLRSDDVVFMNTVAIYENYRDFILLWLHNKRLKHAYWFIHEDLAQLPLVYKDFLAPQNVDRIQRLAKQGSLNLLFPSQRTAQEYRDALKISNVTPVNLHVEVDSEFIKPKRLQDFKTLKFLISGTSSDGRKGQILALSALEYYQTHYQQKHPEWYRPFELHLIAIGDDYISNQIKWLSQSLFQDQIKVYGFLPKHDALAIASICNSVICCSLNETFGLYIAEGMLMGHVILRNDVAGVDEQLVDGKNGLLIDHTDIPKFAAAIEKLLNKSTYSNEALLAMSRASQEIIGTYSKYTYVDQIEAITH